MKTVAIIAARMGSTRFPGKVLKPLGSYPVLGRVRNAVSLAKRVDKVVVATTTSPLDNEIARYCMDINCPVYRGPETDVLKRYFDCAQWAGADVIVRITGDCPFIDPEVIDDVLILRQREGADYASNVDPPTWPDGLDVEAFTMQTLTYAHDHAKRASDRDCLTQYIQRNRHKFHVANLVCPIPGLASERWVLDTEEDYRLCLALSEQRLGWSYRDILHILDRHPELRDLNKKWSRNERFFEQRAKDDLRERQNTHSRIVYGKALDVQPYGASTYSKSAVAFGIDAPLYATHGDGGVIFDVDGEDYVDFCAGLGSVILGYRNQRVDAAIRRQIDQGLSFSLGTELERDVCKRLATLPAGDNMVVLGKNGSDATTAACRIARAYTGRKYITVLGDAYHGWHDWSVGDTQRGHGIPPAPWRLLTGLEHIDHALAGHFTQDQPIAAVIVEPDRYTRDELVKLQMDCIKHGTLLIFDEVFTGLRYPHLLASRHYHIHPDLTCIGKGLANGMPLSALIGRREIMHRFAPGDQPNAFYSTTFGGETLSLAACMATLDELEHGGNEKIQLTAIWIEQTLRKLLDRYGIKTIVTTGAPLNRLSFGALGLASEFRREMAQQGVLIYSSFNVMAAHNEADLNRTEHALNVTFDKIATNTAHGYQQIPNSIMRR